MHNAYADMIVPIWDMVTFTPAFLLAIYWRKKPEFNRRLILIATCTLAAAWGRFPQWLVPPVLFYVGVDLLILLGVFATHFRLSFAGQTVVMYANVHRSAVWNEDSPQASGLGTDMRRRLQRSPCLGH